jgi:hypothetical protein
MTNDKRQAEIEAVARAIYDTQENGIAWDSETLGDWRRNYEREKAAAAIAAFNRVRDARDDDEPQRIERELLRTIDQQARRISEQDHRIGNLRGELAARSPQGEDHE